MREQLLRFEPESPAAVDAVRDVRFSFHMEQAGWLNGEYNRDIVDYVPGPAVETETCLCTGRSNIQEGE